MLIANLIAYEKFIFRFRFWGDFAPSMTQH